MKRLGHRSLEWIVNERGEARVEGYCMEDK